MAPSGDVFVQIQSICESFRRKLRKDSSCRIEDYVDQVAESARPTLFQQLLFADITYRQQKGQSPDSDQYIRRFPQYDALIRQAFYESTQQSTEDLSIATGLMPTVDHDARITDRLGEYELTDELGRGAFGIVYRARHVTRNDYVALKTLQFADQPHPQRDADRLHKFRREFRSLSETNHRHLVSMQTLEFDESHGLWFFTMELVDGSDFLKYVRPDGRLHEKRLRAVLPQLVDGIAALHARHIVHRDLKPGNVMVDRSGRLVILDFGLVAEIQERLDDSQSLRSRHFAGTLRYAAPEQLSGNRPAAADWYAMGVMAYEAITGKAPFTATSQADLIVQKQTLDAPKLIERDDVPEDLAKLVDQLLMRDPDQRPDQTTILTSLSTDGTLSESYDSQDLREEFVSASGRLSTLIGRDNQLAQLHSSHHQWQDTQKPLVVFISGRSGEGKTSLIEHFLHPLRQNRDLLILRGRCYDRESMPYKAIDGLIDALVAELRSQSDDAIAEWIPRDIDMLAQLFPAVRRVPWVGRLNFALARKLDPKQVRHRAFDALKSLLSNLCAEKQVVMFIDDLQWGDADSADVLMELMTPPQAPPLMLLGSYRSDEAHESAFLNRWGELMHQSLNPGVNESNENDSSEKVQHQELFVSPLSPEECEQLMIARIGHDTPDVGQRAAEVHRATGGNPYLVDQLIDCFDPETGVLQPIPLHEVIATRLSRLPAVAESLLNVIAVSGHAISSKEVSDATDLGGSAYSALNRMRNERLVRFIGGDEHTQIDTYHDKIRETVLGRLEDSQRRLIHQTLGETIERTELISFQQCFESLQHPQREQSDEEKTDRIYDLAYHFHAAGETDRALCYCTLAAEDARQNYALDVATKNYAIAQDLAADQSPSIQYRVNSGLGLTQMLAGNYRGATSTLDRAISTAADERQRIVVRAQQAEIVFKTGSLADSLLAFAELLSDLGVRVPPTKFGAAVEIMQIESQTALALRRRSKKVQPSGESWKFPLVIRLLHQLSFPSLYRDPLQAVWASSRARLLALTNGDPRLISLTASQKANITSMFLSSRRSALRDSEQAIQIAGQQNDVALEANALFLHGTTLLWCTRFEEAVDELRRSLELYRRVGDAWRVTLIQNALASAHSRLGNVGYVVRNSVAAFKAAIRFRQFGLAQAAIHSWATVTEGDLPLEEMVARIEETPEDYSTFIMLQVAKSRWHRHHDRTEESLRAAETAVEVLEKYWPVKNLRWPIASPYSCVAYPNLAHALRARADAVADEHPDQCRRLRDRCLASARTGARIESISRYNLPYALRELAYAFAVRGQIAKARKLALESFTVAQTQAAKQQAAHSLLLCGQLGEKANRPEAIEQLDEARTKLAEYDEAIRAANQQAMKDL